MKQIVISVSDVDYKALQAYAFVLSRLNRELLEKHGQKEAGTLTPEDVALEGVRDQIKIYNIMRESGVQ